MEDRFRGVKNPLSKLTGPECERCRNECNFTEDEEAVFNLRARDWSVVHISMTLPMSKRTVTRKIKNVTDKVFLII